MDRKDQPKSLKMKSLSNLWENSFDDLIDHKMFWVFVTVNGIVQFDDPSFLVAIKSRFEGILTNILNFFGKPVVVNPLIQRIKEDQMFKLKCYLSTSQNIEEHIAIIDTGATVSMFNSKIGEKVGVISIKTVETIKDYDLFSCNFQCDQLMTRVIFYANGPIDLIGLSLSEKWEIIVRGSLMIIKDLDYGKHEEIKR